MWVTVPNVCVSHFDESAISRARPKLHADTTKAGYCLPGPPPWLQHYCLHDVLLFQAYAMHTLPLLQKRNPKVHLA